MFSTPGQDADTPKQGAYAGGMVKAGNCPAFPSPRKQENNGLSGEELGTQSWSLLLQIPSDVGPVPVGPMPVGGGARAVVQAHGDGHGLGVRHDNGHVERHARGPALGGR